MHALVIEKDVGTECFQYIGFLNAAEEENFVDSHVPCSQGTDDPFVSGRVSCGYERGADWDGILGKFLLYDGNGLQ